MKNNKKGAALMQVLLIALVLAGIATMLLKVTLSRTSSARKTRRAALAETLIQNCMGEVNSLWASKTSEAFRRDLLGLGNSGRPYMYCNEVSASGTCNDPVNIVSCQYTYPYDSGNFDYQVWAYFEQVTETVGGQSKTIWKLSYQIANNSGATF